MFIDFLWVHISIIKSILLQPNILIDEIKFSLSIKLLIFTKIFSLSIFMIFLNTNQSFLFWECHIWGNFFLPNRSWHLISTVEWFMLLKPFDCWWKVDFEAWGACDVGCKWHFINLNNFEVFICAEISRHSSLKYQLILH